MKTKSVFNLLRHGSEITFNGYDGKTYQGTVESIRRYGVRIQYFVLGVGHCTAVLLRNQVNERLTLR